MFYRWPQANISFRYATNNYYQYVIRYWFVCKHNTWTDTICIMYNKWIIDWIIKWHFNTMFGSLNLYKQLLVEKKSLICMWDQFFSRFRPNFFKGKTHYHPLDFTIYGQSLFKTGESTAVHFNYWIWTDHISNLCDFASNLIIKHLYPPES